VDVAPAPPLCPEAPDPKDALKPDDPPATAPVLNPPDTEAADEEAGAGVFTGALLPNPPNDDVDKDDAVAGAVGVKDFPKALLLPLLPPNPPVEGAF
jgi:hypothetical protein